MDEYSQYRKMLTAEDRYIYYSPWIEQLGERKEAIQSIGHTPYINKKWLDFLELEIPITTKELENVLLAFKDNNSKIKSQFNIEEDIISMSFIINNGDQDPAFFFMDLVKDMEILVTI